MKLNIRIPIKNFVDVCSAEMLPGKTSRVAFLLADKTKQLNNVSQPFIIII